MKDCKFHSRCSKSGTPACAPTCYAYTFMHGVDGGGLWRTTNVPEGYRGKNIIDIEPVESNVAVHKYKNDVIKYVAEGVGLFLFSIPNKDNRLGTGTGKTTKACHLINVFIVLRAQQHLKGEKPIKNNPAYFLSMAEFQTLYNAQFRGYKEQQEQASQRYYNIKNTLHTAELCVIDDIAIRNTTEAFANEFYAIINHRAVNNLTTIFTSNVPLEKLTEIYGERVVSRIDGMTVQIPFTGKDNRKRRLSL